MKLRSHGVAKLTRAPDRRDHRQTRRSARRMTTAAWEFSRDGAMPSRSRTSALLVAPVLVAAACSGSDDSADTSVADGPVADTGAGEGTTPASEPAADPRRLVFEEVQLADGLVAEIPTGWIQSEQAGFGGWFWPPDDSGLDPVVTGYRISVQCAGVCGVRTSAEWDTQVQETMFAQFDDADAFTVSRRESLDGAALVEAINSYELVSFQMARWVDGGERLLTCTLTINEEFADLVAEFEAACRAATAPALG